jgi:formate dehydrogenase maturation protein FdhE
MADITEIFGTEGLSEELKSQVQEAWENKLSEARENISAELREEFAQRYENDKSQIVEAMDNMMSDALKKEISEFAEDKAKVVKERVAYKTAVGEHSNMLSKFITDALVKEVKELREDRDALKGQFTKLEDFVVRQLSKELTEFAQDKADLIEKKVQLVAEGRKLIDETKAAFIKRAAGIVENTVSSTLKNEMTALKDDIKVAKENNFGRKVFEAFAGEYMSSYLNEGGEIRNLQQQIADQQKAVSEQEKAIEQKDADIKATETKLKIAEDKIVREKTLAELVDSLSKDKRQVMVELLESVQTANLKKQFEKYLPAVLNEDVKSEDDKTIITEHTGDRNINIDDNNSINADIVNIKRLAGLRS